MLKSLLGLLVGLFTAGCGWGQGQAKDKFFWTRKHVSFVEQQPIWKNSEAVVHAYFGFDYRNFNDTFQEYHGDPLGPIVGIWKTEQYFGETPSFKDCKKEPEYPSLPNDMQRSSPEFANIVDKWGLERDLYYKCLEENTSMRPQYK